MPAELDEATLHKERSVGKKEPLLLSVSERRAFDIIDKKSVIRCTRAKKIIYFPMILENIDSFLQFNFPDCSTGNGKSFSADDFCRIKEAFASKIKDGFASQYYITGRA